MTLACTIDATGISAPSYADILASLQASMRTIYGTDIYIEPDSQDGQLIAIVARAIYDANQATIAAFMAFSPTFAQGVQLSSVVKINGIRRLSASFSSAVGTVTGQVGTIIVGGVVADTNGNQWTLPPSVTIPDAGEIEVTVTSITEGDIRAPSGSIDQIMTPTAGWQTFVSTADAIAGAPVESDATLRQRQTVSVSIPAQTVLEAMLGRLANLAGVQRVRVYENDTAAPDGNGLPAHSISVVIEGGDLATIAEAIGQNKTMGAATYGSTAQNYTDPVTGILYTIHFYVLATQDIKVVVNLTSASGYSSNVTAKIKQAVADYLNGLAIGEDVLFTRMFGPAYLTGDPDGGTYEITSMTTQGAAGAGTVDLVIPFNKAAICDPAADVTVNVT